MIYISYTNTSNTAVSYVSEVNSSTYSIEGTQILGTGGTPTFSVFDPLNGLMYYIINVGGSEPYYIAELSTLSNHIVLMPVNLSGLSALVVDSSNGMLYAGGINAVYELNPVSLQVVGEILMNSSYTSVLGGNVIDLAYSSQYGMIYATGYVPNGVVEINPSSNSIVAITSFAIHVGPFQTYVGRSSIDSANGILYYNFQQYNVTLNQYISYLVEYKLATKSINIVTSLGSGFANDIAVSPINGLVYISMDFGNTASSPYYYYDLGQLDVYDPANGVLTNYTELSTSPTFLIMDESTNSVMVTNAYSGSVSVFSHSAYGYISGTVSSSDANVTIDGVSIPVFGGHFVASVAAGTYYVSAFGNGLSPAEQSVVVSPVSTSVVDLKLNSSTTTYEVHGFILPSTGSVMFNGISAAVNSLGEYFVYLSPGKYTMSVYDRGYFPFSEVLNLSRNSQINVTLSREPAPTSSLQIQNISAIGFNTTISGINGKTNDTIEVQFNSTGNGTLLIVVPFSHLGGINLTELYNSRVTINGTAYSNFSVSLTSNYTVVLKVTGISGDPTLLWSYGPTSASSPTPPQPPPSPTHSPTIQPPSFTLYYIIGGVVALGLAGALIFVFRRGKH